MSIDADEIELAAQEHTYIWVKINFRFFQIRSVNEFLSQFQFQIEREAKAQAKRRVYQNKTLIFEYFIRHNAQTYFEYMYARQFVRCLIQIEKKNN